MFKQMKSWPLWQKAWFWGVLSVFWITGANFSRNLGNQTYFHTDGSTESMTIFAANHYLDHGFFANYLLPTYPPFGKDPEGNERTEPFVYNHYLAGQDLVLGGFMKVFGRDMMWAGRLIPLTFTAAGMAFLSAEFAAFAGASVVGCILLTLLMIPRSLTVWSICIYGHSYVMAFYLLMIATMLAFMNRGGGTKKQAWGLGVATGILQMFFDLDWVPLTFFAALSFGCLLPRFPWAQTRRILTGMVIGGVIAALYQVVISSFHFGSATWVIDNLLQWAKWRSGAQGAEEGIAAVDLKLHKIWHEYNRQTYGATGFTAVNLLALSGVFLLLGSLSKLRSAHESKRILGGLVLALVAAACWSFGMRQHALAHIRFISRHYFVLYLTFLFIALPISYELVRGVLALKRREERDPHAVESLR